MPPVPKKQAAANAPKARTAPERTAPQAKPTPQPRPASDTAAPKAAPEPDVPRSGPSRALEPFFRGAGLRPRALSAQQATALLQMLGQLARELIVGLQENLQVRAEHKNLVRQPHTTIQSRANNPLKFSAGIEEALDNLLFREANEYISAVESVRECFQDIRSHQQLLMSAFLAALRDYVGRLEPQEIESKIAKKPSTLMGAANKLKYWDTYKEIYEIVTQRSPGQFPQAFIEDLVQAYELELERTAPAGAKSKAQAS